MKSYEKMVTTGVFLTGSSATNAYSTKKLVVPASAEGKTQGTQGCGCWKEMVNVQMRNRGL